jgi:hypothetical protein
MYVCMYVCTHTATDELLEITSLVIDVFCLKLERMKYCAFNCAGFHFLLTAHYPPSDVRVLVRALRFYIFFFPQFN